MAIASGLKLPTVPLRTFGQQIVRRTPRYRHPGDDHAAPIDPNFEGYAQLVTDAEGRCRLKTIKPGAYPDDASGSQRAPHIHLDITGSTNRLVTQMYFAGEPLNEIDRFLSTASKNRGR